LVSLSYFVVAKERGAARAAPWNYFLRILILQSDFNNGAVGHLAHFKVPVIAFDQLAELAVTKAAGVKPWIDPA
jgi:hypothetical protein